MSFTDEFNNKLKAFFEKTIEADFEYINHKKRLKELKESAEKVNFPKNDFEEIIKWLQAAAFNLTQLKNKKWDDKTNKNFKDRCKTLIEKAVKRYKDIVEKKKLTGLQSEIKIYDKKKEKPHVGLALPSIKAIEEIYKKKKWVK